MSGIWKDNRPKPVRDAWTGHSYPSRNQAGVAVAPEAGVDPKMKPSPWYQVNRAFQRRFYDEATGLPTGPDGRTFIDGTGG